jgi:hypothetical protein
VTLYHGGSVEDDVYGNVSFDGMKKVTVMFDERPYFGQISCNLTTMAYQLRVYCPMLHLGQYSDGWSPLALKMNG